ncbi:hypothetical protein [Pseudonocardia sp. TRM90224]|uniref:hypothetical protein n=1 Tax=Pseudonocardia sp. TRM90224 TaxID=2812678 RepID=UPI001E486405|nr:hypothetical protein [Pseudonocardia sp. TRM90224]
MSLASVQVSEPGSLAISAPIMPAACQMPNAPPVLSSATHMRPLPGMSIGSNSRLPPLSVISFAVPSTSSEAR